MAALMAKPKKVALNRWVTQETFDAVKGLALALNCGEGEVLDRAVMLLDSAQNGGAKANSDFTHSTDNYREPNPSVGPFPPTEHQGQMPSPPQPRRISYAEQRKIATEKHLEEVAGKDKLAVAAGRDDIEYDPQS